MSEPAAGTTAAAIKRTLDHATVGIIITDPTHADNPITYVNDGFTALTGYTREEAIGRNCRFLQGEKTHKDDVARIRKAVDARKEISIRITNHRSDGSVFTNQLLISPVEDGGTVSAFLGVQFEAEPDKGTGGGSRPGHAAPPAEMLRELQHRVKNHLAMIVSLIRVHGTRKLTTSSLEALAHRVEALALLYEAMLDPSAGMGDAVPAGAYLCRVAEVVGGLAGRPDIQMKLDCDDAPLSVDAAGRLGLLLTELLTNVFQHAFEGRERGCVMVRFTSLGEGRARLDVEDDGNGLPEGSNWPYDSDTIAEQRGRAEHGTGTLDTTSGGSNSGLGGSIVLGLTDALGAALTVNSGPSGTLVTIEVDDHKLP